MTGLKYDFDQNDLVIGANGSFISATTDNQNVALIAVSQVCRLTKPEVGAQIIAQLVNRKPVSVSSVLSEAKRQAQNDGAYDVVVALTNDDELKFTGTYDN